MQLTPPSYSFSLDLAIGLLLYPRNGMQAPSGAHQGVISLMNKNRSHQMGINTEQRCSEAVQPIRNSHHVALKTLG